MLHLHPGLKLIPGTLHNVTFFHGDCVLYVLWYCKYTSTLHTAHTKSGLTHKPQVCMPNSPFPHASMVSLMMGGSEHLAVNHPARVLPHPPAAQTAHRGCEWHQVPHLRTLDLQLTICCLCCSCQSLKKKKKTIVATRDLKHKSSSSTAIFPTSCP